MKMMTLIIYRLLWDLFVPLSVDERAICNNNKRTMSDKKQVYMFSLGVISTNTYHVVGDSNQLITLEIRTKTETKLKTQVMMKKKKKKRL